MKVQSKICTLCGKKLTSDEYYLYEISLDNYPEAPPQQTYICKEIRKKVQAKNYDKTDFCTNNKM